MQFPQQPNNLDALCDRLDIDHSERQLHGALKSLAAELDVPIILLPRLEHSKNQP